jgi:hypothetical protein
VSDYRQPPVPELQWNPEPIPAAVAKDEYRGQWPGGWAEDPETGHLAFTRDEEPVWACQLCRWARLHTLTEHEQLVRASGRRSE